LAVPAVSRVDKQAIEVTWNKNKTKKYFIKKVNWTVIKIKQFEIVLKNDLLNFNFGLSEIFAVWKTIDAFVFLVLILQGFYYSIKKWKFSDFPHQTFVAFLVAVNSTNPNNVINASQCNERLNKSFHNSQPRLNSNWKSQKDYSRSWGIVGCNNSPLTRPVK
jgi:hypothetical protein